MNYFIIVIFLGFTALTLSYDNSVYGLWVRQSPQELLNGSSTIFVGNITSEKVLQLEKEFTYTTEVNGTDTNIVQNYTLTLDEYSVDIVEFLKNPQNVNKIIVRQPTIGLPSGLGGLDKFKAGDRVLFYLKNLDGINEYSPESFLIPKSCIGKDVLTQKRLESRGESITIQNGMKVDYSNFTANKPVQFIDNEDVDTLSGKSLDFQVYITKTVGSGAEIVFSKEVHTEAKPCAWIASAKWEFTPQEGEYGMAVRISEDNKTYSQYYSKFSVKSDVITHEQMSPLKQFKSGVAAKYVICKEGLQLIIKSEDGNPVCVKPQTAQKLVERGWGMWVGLVSQQNIPILSNSIKIPNSNYAIMYNLKGNGKILEAKMDAPSKSLILSLETTSNGTLTVSIPRALLDIKKNERGEGQFYLLADGRETSFEQIVMTSIDRVFSIPFQNGTKNIEIIATELI